MIDKVIKVSSAFIIGCSTFGSLFSQDTLKFKSLPITKNPIILEKNKQEEINLNTAYLVYALKNCSIYFSPTSTSGIVNNVSIGDEIFVDNELIGDNSIKYFHTAKGYIKHTDFTCNKDYVFYPIDEIKYADYNAPLVDAPNEDGEVVAYIIFNEEISLTGYNHNNYYVYTDDPTLFISKEYLMDEKYVAPAPEPIVTAPIAQTEYITASSGCLTPSAGVFMGPSGKETYYNLDMTYCVQMMRDLGYDEINYPYWIRNDGCKMLGDYIMIAADFSIRPKGSLVATSLGMGIVVDTGTFIYTNPTQVDICVTW